MSVDTQRSTLQRDRGAKQRLCAAAGIPAYWIVNLVDAQVEAYSKPSGSSEESGYTLASV